MTHNKFQQTLSPIPYPLSPIPYPLSPIPYPRMYIDDDELRELYKTSSTEHIQAIGSALMQLEKQPQNPTVLKELLRSAHTLKGDSRMLGVTDVETLVHQIEECLMPIDRGQAVMTGELCDRLHVGLDTIEQLAHTAVTGEPNDVNLFYVLASLMGDGSATPHPAVKYVDTFAIETTDRLFAPVPMVTTEPLGTDSNTEFVDPLPVDWDDLSTIELEADPPTSQLQADFQQLATQLFADDSTLPALEQGAVFNDFTLVATPPATPAQQLDDEFALISFTDAELTLDDGTFPEIEIEHRQAEAIDGDLFPIADELLIPTLDESPLPAAAPTPAPAAPAPTASTGIETIRVDAKQLDLLMGQTGEINVINQQIATRLGDLEAIAQIWEDGSRNYQSMESLLAQIPAQSPLHGHLSHSYQQWQQLGQAIDRFKQAIGGDSARLDLVTSALDSGVTKLRLLPLSTIFNLFPRMVRDLAKSQSKEIDFEMVGGELLLDKRLLEEIKDPLMHILRNAIDHGIEPPAERQQQGKSSTATLTICVRQTGNKTEIEIADDGRGLDLKRIKSKAIARGLYTEAELASLSSDQIHGLIFAPGFSTRDRVTELSGRGVGLDIVKTNIERVKGAVVVNSMLNRGCTFRIQLTHAIGSSQVMLVEVRNATYAIPVEFVNRMLLLDKAEIFAIGGTPTAKIDGKTLAVAWLSDILDLPANVPDYPGEVARTSNKVACLLLESGLQQLALLVDGIRDRQLITIESPHPVLKNVSYLGGSTILGNGEVCLVINPATLFAIDRGSSRSSATIADPVALPPAPEILLVEDSLVIRTQMLRILSGAGYRVTAAVDGREGWDKLQAGNFNLVVSDVEMPRWGGLELTRQIRQHEGFGELPVVLVTTLSQAADRERGFQAGANAYLTKGDFDQQLLLDTLARLI